MSNLRTSQSAWDNPETLTDGVITTNFLADLTVTTPKIAPNAITTSKLADNSVTDDKIVSLGYAKITDPPPVFVLSDGIVTNAKIADGAVNVVKLADWAVDTNKIRDESITTSKYEDGSITTPKIADNAVNGFKIASNSVVNYHIVNESVVTPKIADLAVTNPKLANLAVTEAKLADHSVTGPKLATQVNYDGEFIINNTTTYSSKNSLTVTGEGGIHWKGKIAAGGGDGSLVLGQLNGKASIGGHNNVLAQNDWQHLYIQPVTSHFVRIGSEVPPVYQLDVSGPINGTQLLAMGKLYSRTAHLHLTLSNNWPATPVDMTVVRNSQNGITFPTSTFNDHFVFNRLDLSFTMEFFPDEYPSIQVSFGRINGGVADPKLNYRLYNVRSTGFSIELFNSSWAALNWRDEVLKEGFDLMITATGSDTDTNTI